MQAFVAQKQFVLDQATRILAVDDDPIQREFCCVYLSTPKAQITTADSAEEGLSLLAKGSFDIVLVDVNMPGMDGIEMVRHLRADQRFDEMPIMVITGLEDVVSIDKAFDAGATGFMAKPVNWRLLSHQVKFMIRAHAAIRQKARPDG